MPLLRQKRVLVAKVETTPGTAVSTAAADGVFNVYDPVIQPAFSNDQRDGQSAFSQLASVPGAQYGTLSFRCDVTPGSGADPAWASVFLPACGFGGSSSVYTPKTEPPGSTVKTLTMGIYEDGMYKQIYGAMGNCKLILQNGRRAEAEFNFMGCWSAPTDAAIVAPTYPTLHPLIFQASTISVGAWSPKVQEITIDFGNEVIMREDASSACGYSTSLVVNRLVNGTINPEEELVATKNYYSEWIARTEQALFILMTQGNLGMTIAAPKFQITGIQEGERNGVQVAEITFQCNRSAAAGNDELTLTFDTTP